MPRVIKQPPTITPEQLATLTRRRQEAQRAFCVASRYMKVAQRVHDHAAVQYQTALRHYNKIDMFYAEQTKIHKVKPNTPARPINLMPAKLRKILKDLPAETVENIISNYENLNK